MTDENKVEDAIISEPTVAPALKYKKKRDIFRFNGDKDLSLNLEHVTTVYIEGKRINFQFQSTQTYIDMEDEESAKKVYENILTIWSLDVVE